MNGDRYEHKAIFAPGSLADRAKWALSRLSRYVQDQERARAAIDGIETRSVMRKLQAAEHFSRNLVRQDARSKALAGTSDLWLQVARYLSGHDQVTFKWRRPAADANFPGATGMTSWSFSAGNPAIVEVDPDLSAEERFKTFLHECGHLLDFEQSGTGADAKTRDARADAYKSIWMSHAERNYMRYCKYGGGEFELKLRSLLDYSPLGGG